MFLSTNSLSIVYTFSWEYISISSHIVILFNITSVHQPEQFAMSKCSRVKFRLFVVLNIHTIIFLPIFAFRFINYYFNPLGVFHTSISWGFTLEFEWHQVSWTLLSILTDFNSAVVWMASTRVLIPDSSKRFINPLVTVPGEPITTGITITFMFHSFYYYLLLIRVFHTATSDGLSLEIEWQQVSPNLQDSSQYSGRFQ